MPRRDDWKANIGAGQRRAWSDPKIHRRRSEAIRAAAHGAPARVGRLRGYGNAIVKQQAQAFIEAYMSLNRCR